MITSGLKPEGINITVVSNSLPYITVKDIDYSAGAGFGSISLTLDGVTAEEDQVSSEEIITGEVTIEVKDKSLNGLTSEFLISFQLKTDP